MNQLIIFIKNPVLGKVKTRLAATIGDQRALEIYQQLLEYTLNMVKKVDAEVNLFFSDSIISDDSASKKFLQEGKDLGERMNYAFEKILADHHSRVVIIGTDCAELTSDILQESFTLLDQSDLVIGPANDGGYYLLGMKKPSPFLFENIEWSTEKVFEATRKIAENSGLKISILPVLRDIDTEEDLFTLKK